MRTEAPRALAGRKVTVLGLGLFGGGAATARFLARQGASVTVTDLRSPQQLAAPLAELAHHGLRFVLGRHDEGDMTEADLLVVNPAVPRASRYVQAARRAGVRVTSEAALFLDHTPARVAAVTGTQGKSSTTSFLAQLLAKALPERRVHLGGNIGRSLLDALPQMGADDLVCLELSSYQLEALPEDSLRERADSGVEVGVVINVLEDHLERHGTLEAYAEAKLRLLELVQPGGHVLLPHTGLPIEPALPGDVTVHEHPEPMDEVLAAAAELERFPAFQRENVRLALRAAQLLGAPEAALVRAVDGLRGLPHRLEPIGRIDGRRVWDNGISTTPDSTISALEAVPLGATVMLGGKVKPGDLTPLVRALIEREARVVVFGAARAEWPELLRDAGLEVREAAGPREALLEALELGRGDLLFSPAAASFDAYLNVEQRAEDFLAGARSAGLVRDGGSAR